MKKLFIAMVALLLVNILTYAQTATPKVKQRQVNQQERIREGVKSGALTKREAVRLQAREAKIQHDKNVAKADGKVTPAERAKLNHEQNAASRKIYRQKHDSQVRKK